MEIDADEDNPYKEEKMTKKWWKSKTLWLGVIVVIGGIAEYISGLPVGVAISTIIAGVLGIVIRFLTKQGLMK